MSPPPRRQPSLWPLPPPVRSRRSRRRTPSTSSSRPSARRRSRSSRRCARSRLSVSRRPRTWSTPLRASSWRVSTRKLRTRESPPSRAPAPPSLESDASVLTDASGDEARAPTKKGTGFRRRVLPGAQVWPPVARWTSLVCMAMLALCAVLCPNPSFPAPSTLPCAVSRRACLDPGIAGLRAAQRELDTQGRTPLGCLAHPFCPVRSCHCESHRFPARFLRQDPRTTRGPRPARSADRELRLVAREREVAGAGSRRPGRGSHRRTGEVGARGHLRRDLADRGLRRLDVAVLPRAPLRAGQVHAGGVQGEGLHLLGAAVRDGRVRQLHDW